MLPKLFQHWKAIGTLAAEGADPTMIHAFEERHRVIIPEGMRDYLVKTNGTVDNLKDYFRFLPLEELVSSDDPGVPMKFSEAFYEETCKQDKYFLFVDYLQWCWGYAINLGRNRTNDVRLIGGLSDPVIADSFDEFIDFYLRDDSRLFPPRTR